MCSLISDMDGPEARAIVMGFEGCEYLLVSKDFGCSLWERAGSEKS